MCIRFGFSFTPGSIYSTSQKKPLKLDKALKVIGDRHRSPTLSIPIGLEAGFIQYLMLLVDVGQDGNISVTVPHVPSPRRFPFSSVEPQCHRADRLEENPNGVPGEEGGGYN